jgi:hypothetical protein
MYRNVLVTLCEQILIPLVFLNPYILKVSFCLLLGVIKDIRKIAFKRTEHCGGGWLAYISEN